MVLLVLAAGRAFAQDPTPSIQAVPLPGSDAIRIDGVLDEPGWRAVPAAAAFRQRDPDNGAAASEETEVRVVFDSTRLVIGARLRDREPDRVLANQMQRDQSLSADDRFIVTLDPFLDGRGGFVFQTNPSGVLLDALIAPPSNSNVDDVLQLGAALNNSWDGIWTVRTQRSDEGWSAEIEIPFRTLNFDPSLTTWGINFQRTVRRKSEESLWTGYARNEGVAHMVSAGRLDGLTGISQGVGIDVKPYVVGNVSAAPGRGRSDALATGDVGVDVLYNLTPALRATVSVNTDFAETEVDQRQVNLTRFPLFFQEKRDFFLQGASYFDFGREIGQTVTPFFSRRIGLDDQGVPQPIDVGAKLTGQAGSFDVGVLHVRTADALRQSGGDVTVARVRHRFWQESYVGGLFTRRDDRVSSAVLNTGGADFALRTSTFLGNKTIEWSGWFVHTTNPAGTGRNIGRGSRVAFPNDPFYFDMSYRELQDNYDPAVGFLQRAGFRRYNPEVGYTWRFRDHPWLRYVQQEIDWEFLTDEDDRLLTEVAAIRPLTVVFNDGSEFAYEAAPTYERLERDFEISDGVTLPMGTDYQFTRHEIRGAMADRYPVALGGQVVFGDFFSGRSRELSANVSVRPRPGVAVTFEAERNILDLAEGSFDTDVFRVIANTQFSPWLSVVNNLQYDSVSRLLGWQMRFRWTQRPGNDLFFVYTHNWREFADLSGPRRFETLDNRAATKVVYTLRF